MREIEEPSDQSDQYLLSDRNLPNLSFFFFLVSTCPVYLTCQSIDHNGRRQPPLLHVPASSNLKLIFQKFILHALLLAKYSPRPRKSIKAKKNIYGFGTLRGPP